MYYLKLYNENLISFNMTNDFGLKISDIKIINKIYLNLQKIKERRRTHEKII